MYRQGDVLLIGTSPLDRVKPIPRDERNRMVLALGEATGHAHAVIDPEATLHQGRRDTRFLEVLAEGGVLVKHEEHDQLLVPQGWYRVVRQREHEVGGRSARTIRWAAD
jgi:hypothetical protein